MERPSSYLVGAQVEQLYPVDEKHFRRYRALPTDAHREISTSPIFFTPSTPSEIVRTGIIARF